MGIVLRLWDIYEGKKGVDSMVWKYKRDPDRFVKDQDENGIT